MTEESANTANTPWHLWVVGIISLLWNGFGAFDYIATVFKFDFYLSQFPQDFLDYIYGMPTWMFVIWAIAIFTGLFGSIFLLMRKGWAVPAFEISLLGAVGSAVAGFAIDTPDQFKNYSMTAVIFLIAVFLVVYAVKMKRYGVLK